MSDNGSRVLWLTAGVAIGATVALLFAPASGQVTRRRIMRKTAEGKDVLAESGRDIADLGREYFEKGRQIADEAAEIFDRGRRLVQG